MTPSRSTSCAVRTGLTSSARSASIAAAVAAALSVSAASAAFAQDDSSTAQQVQALKAQVEQLQRRLDGLQAKQARAPQATAASQAPGSSSGTSAAGAPVTHLASASAAPASAGVGSASDATNPAPSTAAPEAGSDPQGQSGEQSQGSAQMSATQPFGPTSNPSWQAGPVKMTFGGFTALESVYRNKNETADIGSNYNTGIPYPDSSNYYLDEFRESARQSRFALLAQGPEDGAWRAEGYLETDFLSGGVTSNSSESNSYTLRMRHFYGVISNTDLDWYLLAGQTWSYATLSTTGTMKPRTENVPLTIDAQYVVGFNWTRNAQLRFVKMFGNWGSWGLSLESPQAAFTGSTPPTTVTTNPGVGGGLLPSTNNYSLDFAPDIITKFAFDPGWGHFEIYGMERGFRDRYEPIKGSVGGTNNTTWGGSVGAGMILPFTKMLSFQASALYGNGIGRYGSGGLPDVTVDPYGDVSAIREADVLLGLVFKPTSRLTFYLYGGEEEAQKDWWTLGKTLYGYGNPGQDNLGCDLQTGSSATCVANTQKLEQVIIGDWWKVYEGPIGNFQIGLQYTYEDRVAFYGMGAAPSTNLSMGFVSFRYYPYQR
ncbi:MAG TPA: hypothetical protein VMD49_00455 [Steroidobacteraceae bacterium]|nr:hypothetical protein [Steroidobacteraceae bacterium]